MSRIPYRVDIAGGWFDQPWVSKIVPGAVLTVSIEPTYIFPERSGMATSTRKRAVRMWGDNIPDGDREELAKMLFCYDNFPGSEYISGSQDAIGITIPGLNKLNYNGEYWPEVIETAPSSTIQFIEENCRIVPSTCKPPNLQILNNLNLSPTLLQEFSLEVDRCWDAALCLDAKRFGRQVTAAFAKQMEVVPKTIEIINDLESYQNRYYGAKLTGSGGFIFVVSPEPIDGEIHVKVRPPLKSRIVYAAF
ncbi:MAG: hypothetical protein H7831_06660 [Magnetococcus sp. WYHC-3]